MKPKFFATLLLTAILAGCTKTTIDEITGSVYLNNKSVGESANELLSSTKYKSVKVEVLYMTGFAPDSAALVNLQNFLATYLNKPNGITITTTEISSWSKTNLAEKDIEAIEDKDRSAYNNGDQIALYILYTNGTYADNNNVLGIAYKNTSIALFGQTIHNNSGGIGQSSRTKLESTVLEHELGHLLGLVDVGTSMQTPHKDTDPTHGSHCNNSNCLMYYSTETTDVLGFLVTGNIPTLDANCVADLKANGSK